MAGMGHHVEAGEEGKRRFLRLYASFEKMAKLVYRARISVYEPIHEKSRRSMHFLLLLTPFIRNRIAIYNYAFKDSFELILANLETRFLLFESNYNSERIEQRKDPFDSKNIAAYPNRILGCRPSDVGSTGGNYFNWMDAFSDRVLNRMIKP